MFWVSVIDREYARARQRPIPHRGRAVCCTDVPTSRTSISNSIRYTSDLRSVNFRFEMFEFCSPTQGADPPEDSCGIGHRDIEVGLVVSRTLAFCPPQVDPPFRLVLVFREFFAMNQVDLDPVSPLGNAHDPFARQRTAAKGPQPALTFRQGLIFCRPSGPSFRQNRPTRDKEP